MCGCTLLLWLLVVSLLPVIVLLSMQVATLNSQVAQLVLTRNVVYLWDGLYYPQCDHTAYTPLTKYHVDFVPWQSANSSDATIRCTNGLTAPTLCDLQGPGSYQLTAALSIRCHDGHWECVAGMQYNWFRMVDSLPALGIGTSGLATLLNSYSPLHAEGVVDVPAGSVYSVGVFILGGGCVGTVTDYIERFASIKQIA